MAIKPLVIPKGRVFTGEDLKILAWILTPTGATTPNSVHIWKDDGIWEDSWVWTEEPVTYKMALTRTGTPAINTTYVWDDSQLWLDNLIWTENV